MNIERRKTRVIDVGGVKIGYPHPISIQSMTTTATEDIDAAVRQIKQLEDAGCEIIRLSVLNKKEAHALREIKRHIAIPLVADIHFDYKLALLAINFGCDAVRINPGNIYKDSHHIEIVKEAKKAKIPVRIGVNSGSISNPEGLKKSNVDLMVESALRCIKIYEKQKFYDTIISLKASDILQTVCAYRKMAGWCDYPMHLGITAAGLPETGIIRSAIGIGALLLEGIGDTIRVSLTGDPRQEIETAKELLASLRLREFGPRIISCPTCGRCKVDLAKIVKAVDKELKNLKNRYPKINSLKIAVMGCEVNGPGEAQEADVGVACSRGSALLFAKGRKIKKIKLCSLKSELINFIKNEMV